MKGIIILMLVLIMIPSVQAFRYTPSCLDNMTVLWEGTLNRTIDGNTTAYTFNYTERCDFGCINDTVTSQCSPAPFNVAIYIILPLLLGIIVIFYWMVKK